LPSSTAFPSAKSGKSAEPVKSSLSQLETTNASQNSCGGTFLAVCHQRSGRLEGLDLGICGPHGDGKRRRSRPNGGPAEPHHRSGDARHQRRRAVFGGFQRKTKYIRITCEVQCAIKVGGTATTSSMPIGAMSPEYFGVQPGATLSVIANP
jgi:hypothetical protein